MKIQYIGDGTRSHQVFTAPGVTLKKWQSTTAKDFPQWVITAPKGAFLIDGKPNTGKEANPKLTAPAAPAPKPAPKPPAK